MGLTSEQRVGLQRFVAKARKLVADDFMVQMQSVYGLSETTIQPLEALPALSQAELTVARILRERLGHIRSGTPEGRDRDAIAFARLARELSFGLVNRFAAIRMAEKRQLIEEALASHYESTGFLNFKDAASSQGSAVVAYASTYEAYRQFLRCLFDELATDLGEVMASGAANALLFPTEAKLTELIALMNDGAVDPLWAEDETIGWIYQYYNDPEERKQMRDDSQAPRSSREMAVRNQFFTPRYVVEFLTDNTIGRLWYEMTEGATSLVDRCRYLVRRPQTKFLAPEEKFTAAPIPPELPSAERLQLLEEIPHRPLKDPRALRFLDPACGSMHFGLYAFELFEVIYAEAWERSVGTLRADYPDRETFRREVPRLILENNIYGVDIDPRAVQIARLALWLRAQKAWQQLRVAAVNRPQIRKSHVVCAEPMPGNRQLLDEFISAHLAGTPENEILAKLLRRIVESMELAGEAGVLLRIEGAIADAVKQEKGFDQAVVQKALPGLGVDGLITSQDALPGFSMGRVANDSFWASAEARLYAELARYSTRLEQGGLQRRMFAEDAAQGFAFIDICRERFDVIVMNPPFGEAAEKTQDLLNSYYPNWAKNVLSCFITRGAEMLTKDGLCGAIFDRTAIVKSSYEKFRLAEIVGKIFCMADTGWEVLDANVETTCLVLSPSGYREGMFYDLRRLKPANKSNGLTALVKGIEPIEDASKITMKSELFSSLPNSVIGYDFERFALRIFKKFKPLTDSGYQARKGHDFVSDIHLRNYWELSAGGLSSSDNAQVYNGSSYSLYVAPRRSVAMQGGLIESLSAHKSVSLRNIDFQLKPGIGFGKRGDVLDAHILPAGNCFTAEGQAIHGYNSEATELVLLACLNSKLSQYLINLYCGQHKGSGYVNLLPFLPDGLVEKNEVHAQAERIIEIKRKWLARDESTLDFCAPFSRLPSRNASLAEMAETCVREYNEDLIEYQKLIRLNDEAFYKAAGIDSSEREAVEHWVTHFPTNDGPWPCLDGALTGRMLTESAISHLFGVLFDRWQADPTYFKDNGKGIFDLLPSMPPGFSDNTAGAAWYYLQDDIYLQLSLLAKKAYGTWDVFEANCSATLGVSSLNNWFIQVDGFFTSHLKRYTKSGRPSPIYWPLSVVSGKFTIWVYYPKLDNQSLPKLIADVLSPKIRTISQEIENRRATPGSKIAELEALRMELEEMRTDFFDLINRGYQPNQNDGVLITACPLAKYFRHAGLRKNLEICWKELARGDYDWAHLAMAMWPERVLAACKKDRSIAIAHGREDLCRAEPPKAARGRKKTPPST